MTEELLANLPIPRDIIIRSDLIFINETVLKNRTGDTVNFSFHEGQRDIVYCYKDTALIYQEYIGEVK